MPMANDQTLVAISFSDTFRATEFLTAATRLAAEGHLVVRDAVFLVKDGDGKTYVKETTDLETGGAALTGALWASLFGLVLGGPVGLLVGGGIGAGAGALTAKAVDIGVTDELISQLREAAQAGTTTLILLVSHIDQEPLLAELHRFEGARLVYGDLPESALDRLRDALSGEANATG
ncbi:hypothetical protein BH24ACT2_BH24ACT2_00210 [soil metagenome]